MGPHTNVRLCLIECLLLDYAINLAAKPANAQAAITGITPTL